MSQAAGYRAAHRDPVQAPTGPALLVVNELGAWAPAWDGLVNAAPVPSPFLRSWWLGAVATEAARFVLFVEDGTLIGGLALQLRRRILGASVFTWCGAGVLCPDHLDVLAEPGREVDVCHALNGWLTGRGARLLDLDGVVQNSLLAAALPARAITGRDVAPWDALPRSGADYLAARSPGLRKSHRNGMRRLTALGIEHRRIGPADLEPALDEFERLHRARPGRERLLAEMGRLRPALRAGAAIGEVRVDALCSAHRTVAVDISLRVGTAPRVYQCARSLDHELRDAGTVLLLALSAQACEEGASELDLLRGDEPYKSRFVGHTRTLHRVRVAHGRRGLLLLGLLRAGSRARAGAGVLRRRLRSASAWRPRGPA